jgi:hypothetical protein
MVLPNGNFGISFAQLFSGLAKGGNMTKQKGKWLGTIIAVLILAFSFPAHGHADHSGNMPSRFSLGAGIGIPFGVIGLGCEVNPIIGSGPDSIARYFSLNLGLGFSGAGIGYSLGLRFYPLGRDRVWAPKISILYGTVLVVNWEYMYRGFSAGAGIVRRLNRRTSVDADLIFIINRFGFYSSDWSGGRLKVSLGLRRNFD